MAVIEVKNLQKHFGKIKAVDGVSFSVKKGEIFGFLGPNGAGKTTTIRCLMDFIHPNEGEIEILGFDAQKETIKVKEEVGYLSDELGLYANWTGKAHIKYLRELNGNNDIADQLICRLDFDPSRKTKELSSGNRQKLGLILALMFEPKVLIFDEPTKALDPLLQNTVYELIEESVGKGATVFMSSHNLPEVQRVCDRVGIIRQGKMVATESVLGLKEKKIYSVTVYFGDGFEEEDFKLPGVKIYRKLKNGLVFEVKGDITPLIQALGKYKLRDLSVTEASLEEIFLEFYQEEKVVEANQ